MVTLSLNPELLQPQMAFLPLIGWALAGLLAVLFSKIVLKGDSEPNINTRRVVILGMKGAGKTTLWKLLKQGEATGESIATAGTVNMDTFKLRNSEGTLISIENPQDIGGGRELFLKQIEMAKSESDFIYFLFDISRFFQEKEYAEEVKARIEVLKEYNIKLVCTHLDKTGLNEVSCIEKLGEFYQKNSRYCIIGNLLNTESIYEKIRKEIVG